MNIIKSEKVISNNRTQRLISKERVKLEEKMGGGSHVLKRIPRIKFPERHAKSSLSGSSSQTEKATTNKEVHQKSTLTSDVPAAPSNPGVGGKASFQPKRTPVSDREIEAILLGGCF